MRDLVHPGSIYVRYDPRVNGFIRLVMNEIFWNRILRNKLSGRTSSRKGVNQLGRVHDLIYFYSKSESLIESPALPKLRKQRAVTISD